MSFCNEEELEKCIADLAERAKPSKNDIRYERYVEYINCFISKFGKEQVHLVGSTGERSKLAYSKDDGDADFLIVSGRLEILVENLIPNQYAPCYMWIKADQAFNDSGCEFIQNKFLSTKTLRGVKPELFTILRAIYFHFPSKMDKITNADHKNVAVLKISSKVGLQTTSYKNLEFDKSIPDIRNRFPHLGAAIYRRIRPERLRNMQICKHEKKIYRRLFEVVKFASPKSGKSIDYGGIGFFVKILGEELLLENLLFRLGAQNAASNSYNSKVDIEDESTQYQNDLDCADLVKTTETLYRATFTKTSHKDFVPALMIKGKLKCMKNWKTRVEALKWSSEMINRIYNKQIFVVARTSPVNPNPEKDFCLSFNLPEKEMMHSASPTQKKVFWIMKAFLKGVFESFHEEKGKELKLKTYHIKHLFFWLYEEKDVREMQSVSSLLKKTLMSLTNALRKKELRHYFVESNNMFVEFEGEDFELLITCVDKVMKMPIESLKFYIQLNKKSLREVWLTEEEMVCFLERMNDGGRPEYIEKLEEAMFDFQRGVNEMRDADGCSPLVEAIVDTLKLCLQNDGSVNLLMIKNLNDVLTYGQTNMTQIDTFKADKNIEDTVTLLVELSRLIPKLQSYLNQFGGSDGLRHILWGAFCGKPLDMNMDLREQIVDAVRRYLSCSDGEENTLCSELKYKLFGYILFRKEFSDLSGVRQV